MKNINKFAQSEMPKAQEKKYIESLYGSHYDAKLKKDYAAKLSSEYNVNRSDAGSDTSSKTSKIRYLFMGATAIAAIFAMVFVFMPMMNNTSSTNPQQYAQSLITIDKMDAKRGKQEDSQLRIDLKQNYNAGKWADVLNIYDQLELTSEDLYFKGRTLLNQKKYKEAISSFSLISNPKEFKFSAELQYWLAIAYASDKDYSNAKPLLNKVMKSGWKVEEAKALLESMK